MPDYSISLSFTSEQSSTRSKQDKFHLPKLRVLEIPIWLYADYADLISQSPTGLQRLLQSFSNYCWENDMTINTAMLKILVFTKQKRLQI